MSREAPVVLLAGPGSRRLEALALERAALLLCRTGPGDAHPDDCGECRRVFRREHPDLLVAAPEGRRRSNTPSFEEGSESKETTIPTALIRAIASAATRLPYEARWRAVLLLDVERTEPAAFSALLKILEEPPARTRFILTATRPRLLPPTILSRVTVEALRGTTRKETAAALRVRGLSADEARARAAFVPSDADEAAAFDLSSARSRRDALLEAASGLFLSGSISWAIGLGVALSGEDAEGTTEALGILALLLRDAVAAGADPEAVIHAERRRDLERLGSVPPGTLLSAASRALDLASTLVESRRNTRLAAEAFALSLASPA